MAPTPWRGCHSVCRRAVLQIRRSPLPRFPLGSRRPKFRGLDTVALRLEVQGLVVRPEEPSCLEAHEEGLARFIGMTGHGWTIAAMHRRSLERFDVDAVLLPYNSLMAQQERYRRNFEEVLDVCRERNAAVQAIKSIARGPGPPPPGRTRPGTSRSGAGGHRPRGPLGPRRAGRLPQHRRRPDVASQGVGGREPLRAPSLGRRDGGDARLDADDLAVRPRDLTKSGALTGDPQGPARVFERSELLRCHMFKVGSAVVRFVYAGGAAHRHLVHQGAEVHPARASAR